MDSLRGKFLGRYEIVAEVGRGAMGAVYKARDPKIDRLVAIKTVLLHQSVIHEQEEFRRRFFLEAKAAGRLLHPGIVALFDVGEHPDTSDPYIVMEYIEGQTLRELIASNGKKLPVDDALRIAQQLAEALDYAHTQGVVHRDIKPANILITKEGQAKISDFGIAQLDLTHMTLPGRVLGTPAYMSPEQLEGEQVDGRSDLFSLGAILYTSVTGYRPFQGNSATTVCYKVANRDPLAATALAPELPHELDAVIARALAKNPAERYQRGKDFADELRKLREKRPVRKSTIWFSPPAPGRTAPGRTWLDGQGASERSARTLAAKTSMRPLHAAPRKTSSLNSMFSSWQVQMAIGIPLFAATMVVSLFAWREIREQRIAAKTTAATRIEARNTPGIPQTASVPVTAVAHSNDQPQPGPQAASDSPPAMKNDSSNLAAQPAPNEKTAHSSVTRASGPPRKASSTGIAKAGTSSSVKTTKLLPTKTSSGATPGAGKLSGNSVEAPAESAASVNTSAVADSNVEIRVDNRFSDATLKVWIDDHLAYSHPLHDGHKKRLMLLGGGTKEAVTIPVSSGKHALRIEVRSASEQYDETKTVDGDFLTGGERVLAISFDKHSHDMHLALGSE